MSTTGGVFGETTLNNIRVRADRMAFDDRIKQQYIPRIDVIQAFMKAMTADFKLLTGKKTVTAEVMWMNACDITTQAPNHCDWDCNELSTNTNTYELDQTRESCFAADENHFDTNEFDFEEAMAKGMLSADKVLCEYVAQQIVAAMNAFAGVNALGDTSQGTVLGNATYIPAAYWTAELLSYLALVENSNRFTSPVMISGRNLYQASLLAAYNSGNADGKGKESMFNAMNLNFDLYNIDLVNNPLFITYMLSLGSVAFVSGSKYDRAPVTRWNPMENIWAEPSRFFPGLIIEWHQTNSCNESNGRHLFSQKGVINFGIYNNPAGCDENNTGVLQFICGEPS